MDRCSKLHRRQLQREKIEKIYIAGDGAPWIKEGLKWILKSRFVLDRYHLNKYVLKATSKEPKYRIRYGEQ